MNVGVLGAGSLGLLYTFKLSAICGGVEIITRTKAQAEQIRRQGITLEGEALSARVAASAYEARERALFQLDYLLLTVKQFALDEALVGYIDERLTPSGRVICFQNGVGHVEKLLSKLKPEQVMLAVTTEGAKKSSEAAVAHTGRGFTYLGPSTPHPFGQDFAAMEKNAGSILEKAGFSVILSNHMDNHVWSKLILNSVINPLTAILQVRNGELLESSSAKKVMAALYEEGRSVAKAKKIELPSDLWETILSVCEKTAANHSSMLQDRLQSNRTEIDWINGSLLRMANEEGLQLPVHLTIYQLIKALENK